MQERQRSWSVVWAWTSCRVQASFHAPSVALEWAATASSAIAASSGWTRNAVGSSAWQRTLITYVHCARELHASWMEGSPSRTWQARGGSFLLLFRRHALSSRWLWTFNHVLLPRRSSRSCYQSSSNHLSFKTCGGEYSSYVQSIMLPASETWPLTKPNLRRLQQSNRTMIRQICNVKPPHCHHQVQWATYAAWHWITGPHSEGENLIVGVERHDMSTLVGHFVSSPREREKWDRRDSREDEREGQGRKRNRNESEETEDIKTFLLYL